MDIKKEEYKDGYYHLRKDIEDYPEAWCYIVYSRRGPGKTYSALRMFYADNIPFCYMKRTNKDVAFICSGNTLVNVDPSPFAPLNRDFGLNVKAKLISEGFGAFYNADSEGNIAGSPVGYIVSLNNIKEIKGFDLSACDYMLLDEFIPQQFEIVKKAEGDALLDAYMSVSRDRLKRGRDPLKLLLFANAEEISTPIIQTLEVMDDIADMKGSHKYIEDRDILIHRITAEEVPITEEEQKGIFKGMKGTAWHDKSFGDGVFANNDFTNICKMSMKNMTGMIKLTYKRHDYYIYYHPNKYIYYMTKSPCKCPYEYDLAKENDQKKFYMDFGLSLRAALADSRMFFKNYSMYDLINNYKRYFKL